MSTEMDRQAVFTQVKNHLLAQGEPALGERICMYRAPDGKMCAVGCLIPDENYSPLIEGKGVRLQEVYSRLPFPVSKMDLDLLERLQYIHDKVHPSEWPFRLAELADTRGLK